LKNRPDGNRKYIDAVSHKYTGKPFPFRSPEGRVALVIEPFLRLLLRRFPQP
jgi:hypothetical protein